MNPGPLLRRCRNSSFCTCKSAAVLPNGCRRYLITGSSWCRFYSAVADVQQTSDHSLNSFIVGGNGRQRPLKKATSLGSSLASAAKAGLPSVSPQGQSAGPTLAKAVRSTASEKHQTKGTAKNLAASQQKAHATLDTASEAELQRRIGFPSSKQYMLGGGPTIYSQPRQILEVLGGPSAKISLSNKGSPGGGWACSATFSAPEQAEVTQSGTGSSKKRAERVALLLLAATLHTSGTLEALKRSATLDTVDQEVMADEANAKADVYNYAARFDLIPQFSVKIRHQPHTARKSFYAEVNITLPEQNIDVTARGKTLPQAEIAASLRFKTEAEKYHARHGDDTIVIKDATALTTDNAQKFFKYLRIEGLIRTVVVSFSSAMELKSSGAVPQRAQISIDGVPTGHPVEMLTKSKAEALAYLTAAITFKKSHPKIYPKFLQALYDGNGDILRPMAPLPLCVTAESTMVMRETLHKVRKAGLPDILEEVLSDEEMDDTRPPRQRRKLTGPERVVREAELKLQYQRYLENPTIVELRKKKAELPMNQHRAQVLDIIENNQYSIIVGATGSGKTTQVPQILVERAIQSGKGAVCNVICTQPRRIAATSVARRVAEERSERFQDTIGYHVRFDCRRPQPGGSINYCTTGILLQQLQYEADYVLDEASHLIIDEVHERDMQIDFLLAALKKAIEERTRAGLKVPKVVLMSATMDTELFAGYFKQTAADGSLVPCPSLTVPGRTFPVKETYLEDVLDVLRTSYPKHYREVLNDDETRKYLNAEETWQNSRTGSSRNSTPSQQEVTDSDPTIDWKAERVVSSDGQTVISTERDDSLMPFRLISATVAHVAMTTQEGAILVFLPGIQEILRVDELLRMVRPLGVDFGDESKFKMYMLHSTIPAAQTDVFDPVPEGCRKIILATNIAETSVTIADVQHVIDCGKMREKQYDQIGRYSKLICTWISKSNSRQRAGRAGRVQNGNYYALFSRERYSSLRNVGLPEILRSDLQEICLAIKMQRLKSSIRDFLAQAIEPPSPMAVDSSVRALQTLDALTEHEEITPLGRLLGNLPVHPGLGKMIVLGVIFRCLDPMLVIGAAAGERSLFVSTPDTKRRASETKRSFAEGSKSDHIASLNAVRRMREMRSSFNKFNLLDFAYKNFIHMGAFKTIEGIAGQIEDILVKAGLIPYTAPQDRYNNEFGHPSLNKNSANAALIKALVLAGSQPRLGVSQSGRTYRTANDANSIVHGSSVIAPNYLMGKEDERVAPTKLVTYSVLSRPGDGKASFIRDNTIVTPLMAVLFGGRLKISQSDILYLDRWLPFYANRNDGQTAKTIMEFRKALDRLLSGAFMDLRRREDKDSTPRYLADKQSTEIFAKGLVEVLHVDALTHGMPSW